MFSGIVEATASVEQTQQRELTIEKAVDVHRGDSVSVNGVCLTVAELNGDTFRVELSEETQKRTTLGKLEPGQKVNLERAMPANGRFGGHLVQGHADGIGYMLDRDEMSGSVELLFEAPPGLEKYIVEKGSVAVDGVSLTVAGVNRDRFTVSVIPHTLESTNLGGKKAGDPVNVEVDIIAKYVEKLVQSAGSSGTGADAEAAVELPGPPPISRRKSGMQDGEAT